ncbi:MAG: PAS domain S-box protein [Desulfobulbaceae bacterium]|nr:PAS domain S-box protein [Desulfobulbaceae bacterium]
MTPKKKLEVEPTLSISPSCKQQYREQGAPGEGGSPSPAGSEQTLAALQGRQVELEKQIEEQRQARAVAEAAMRKYYDLYDLAPVGYCILDHLGKVREINRAGAALLGLDRSRLLDRCLVEFVATTAHVRFGLFLERIFSSDNKVAGEIKVPGRVPGVARGERYIFLEGGAFISSAGERLSRIVLIDVTEFRQFNSEREHYRYQLEELVRQRTCQLETVNVRLRDQAENLTSIYQALDSIGLIVCSLERDDAHIEIFSTGAEKMFGYRQEEAIGRSIALIYPSDLNAPGFLPDRVKRLRLGQVMQSFDMTLQRKSGECFPVVVSIHPFARQGSEFSKVVGVIRDISELMRAQAQLQAINNELERRVEQRTLELQETQKQMLHAEKLSAIGKLSASIAHEFNNPLQGILSILKGLRKRAILEEEDRQLLEAAIGESDRIKELIRNLQDFNRPSPGKKMVVDVHKSLNSVLLLHKSDFKGKRIAVVLDYAEQLPQILAVPDQIKQVFLNLLANAADACQKLGGVITVSTRQLDGNQVAVAIKDNGIGIKPEEIECIFQPFYTTKPEVKGTGLGLSVSYGIIKQHQGEIQVESRPGEGATFTVLLPIKGSGEGIPAFCG